MSKFYSTKTYGNDRGLSCAFRQWRATHSHCSLIHGYSLGFKLVFECESLDERNWVMDFGAFKSNGIKEHLSYIFDHTTIVAADDPELDQFKHLEALGLIQLRVLDHVGCEKFAIFLGVLHFLTRHMLSSVYSINQG